MDAGAGMVSVMIIGGVVMVVIGVGAGAGVEVADTPRVAEVRERGGRPLRFGGGFEDSAAGVEVADTSRVAEARARGGRPLRFGGGIGDATVCALRFRPVSFGAGGSVLLTSWDVGEAQLNCASGTSTLEAGEEARDGGKTMRAVGGKDDGGSKRRGRGAIGRSSGGGVM